MPYCTSINCQSWGCDYCPKCSHYMREAEGVDKNGKTWRWEFHNYCGPVFLRKDGQPLKRHPGEHSPAWDVFNKWWETKD